MSSPWDPAIAQAMQRHGGSNRSIPRTQSTPVKSIIRTALLSLKGSSQGQVQEKFEPSEKRRDSGSSLAQSAMQLPDSASAGGTSTAVLIGWPSTCSAAS